MKMGYSLWPLAMVWRKSNNHDACWDHKFKADGFLGLHIMFYTFCCLCFCGWSPGLGVLGKISHGTAAAHEKGDFNLLRSQALMLCKQILYGRDGRCSTESSFRVGGLGEKEGGQGRLLFLDQACHWECILRDIALIGVFYFCFLFFSAFWISWCIRLCYSSFSIIDPNIENQEHSECLLPSCFS